MRVRKPTPVGVRRFAVAAPSPRLLVNPWSVFLFVVCVGGAYSAAAQSPVTATEAPHTFSNLKSVRELPDGRVLVLDALELAVWVVDFASGTRTRVGRNGRGPGEYQWPGRLLALSGDSTALFDDASLRLLVIRPDGTPGGTLDRETGGPSAPRSALLAPVRAVDAQGRRYGVARFPAGTERAPPPDTVALERWAYDPARPDAERRDTVAWLPSTGLVAPRGRITRRAAYDVRPDWAVAPDGRVAIVQVSPYRVDFYLPNGTVRRGPVLPAEPIPVTAAVRRQFLTEAQRPVVYYFGDRNGGPGRFEPTRRWWIKDEDWDFPTHLPPFLPGGVRFAPDGRLWIERTTAPGRPATFDVVDERGAVVRQVELAPGERLLGFGKSVMYVVRTDEDELQYLRRRAYPRAP